MPSAAAASMKLNTTTLSPSLLNSSGRLSSSKKSALTPARTVCSRSARLILSVTVGTRAPFGPGADTPRFEVKTRTVSEK